MSDGELVQRAERLEALAAKEEDPRERERLLEAAAESRGASLNGAAFARPPAGE